MDALQTPTNGTPEQIDIRLNRDIAAFGYIWVMSLVVYFTKRESPFARFHSKQGIVLFLLSIPVSFIPFLGKYLMFLLAAGMLLGFINAAQGQKRDVPFIGPLSRGELKFDHVLSMVMHAMRNGFEHLRHLVKKNQVPAPVAPATQETPV